MLPNILKPRIYALEYIRQTFASYFEHFVKFKKSITFKLLVTIGQFTTNSRTAREMIVELLKYMKIQTRVKMHYNPYHIISEKRLQAKFSTYKHQGDQLLEKIDNKDTYEQVKEILIISGKIE